MKKSELKKILKPIVEECIKETLLEGGVLSSVIAEVARGLNNPPATAQAEAAPTQQETLEENNYAQERRDAQRRQINETRQKMLDAIGNGSYNGVNLFEGTEPLSSTGDPGTSNSPLSGTPPGDSGVDISKIAGSRNWSKMI